MTAAVNPRPSRRSAARRQELLDAALRAIRRSGPPVGVDTIASEAGITRPVLYRYFGDVGGIYEAVATHFAVELGERVREVRLRRRDAKAMLRAQVHAYLSLLDDERNLYRFLTRQFPAERADGQAAVAAFVRIVGDVVADFIEAAGAPALRAKVAGHSFVGAIQSSADWWLDHAHVSRAEMADELADFLWAGFSGYLSRETSREVRA